MKKVSFGLVWLIFFAYSNATLDFDSLSDITSPDDLSYSSGYYPIWLEGDKTEGLTPTIAPEEHCGDQCDCLLDCLDASDELNCSQNNHHCGFEHAFQCKDTDGGVYLGGFCRSNRAKAGDESPVNDDSGYCDGYKSCSDGSDEPDGVFGFKCRVSPHQSKYRPDLRKKSCTIDQNFITRWKDLKQDQICSDYSICPDDETEVCYLNNSSNLNATNCFQCLDGMIIRTSQICDGKIDCMDLSDECLCSNKTSTVDEFCNLQIQHPECIGKFACADAVSNDTVCVEKSDLCNSSSQCPSELCQAQLPTGNYSCEPPGQGHTGSKIVSATKCDGRPECRDFEDECQNCDNPPAYCSIKFTGGIMHNCTEEGDNSRSHEIQSLWVCNGFKDCVTGLDEALCEATSRQRCYPPEDERYDTFDTHYEKCDFIKDCDNYADEQGCEGRLYCEGGPEQGIRESQKTDGKLDCLNGEDECEYKDDSFSNGQSMIKSEFIIASMWIMAVVALVGNAVVIYNCAKDLRETYRVTVRGRVGVCNKTLVLNLALADFLMGLYLLILAIKAVQFNSTYCGKWQNWRSSGLCSGLGSLAMLSSQTSVLIMVMMTTYRFYSVRNPFRAEKLKARYLVAAVLVCWIPPIFLAFMPLSGHSMAFAFQSRTKLPFFDSAVVEKPNFHKFVFDAWILANRSRETFGSTEWNDLLGKFCDLFGEVCGPDRQEIIVEKWYGYYSADSVCLPRLFPHINDSGWDYTAGVIIFDFLAFVYILLAYTVMYVCTVKRSSEPRNGVLVFGGRGASFSSVDENRVREDRVIWRRISRLLFTDFLCWMPICITCIISLAGHQIPPVMYQISAAFFLPINSALNPLLYSNAVNQMVARCFPDGVLRCVGLNKLNLCSRGEHNGIRTPRNHSRTNGVVASATDETRASRDQLAPEAASELDRNRNVTMSPEGFPLVIGHKRSESGVLSFQTETPSRNHPEFRSTIARSMARMSRIFSDRRGNNRQLDERATFPRTHRPKSQSTTSTSTTFTTCGQEP